MKIGVDGGGSKTECILVDARGEVVARHRASGCNPSVIGPERARVTVDDALRDLTAKHPGNIESTLLCMAGSAEFWREFASSLSGYGRVETAGDALPVLELATGGRPGIALHAGTGSFVIARAPDLSIHHAGGLGWRFGDEGSAYDIGRRAVARALLEAQGWSERSEVGRVVARLANTTEAAALTRHFYTATNANHEIAVIAPHITALADANEAAAREIVEASVGAFARLAKKVVQALFPAGPVPCGVSGVIFQTACARETLGAALRDAGPLRSLSEPPIEGVRRLLARMP